MREREREREGERERERGREGGRERERAGEKNVFSLPLMSRKWPLSSGQHFDIAHHASLLQMTREVTLNNFRLNGRPITCFGLDKEEDNLTPVSQRVKLELWSLQDSSSEGFLML